MQKVGMSKKEVKATIRKQVLMVFFVPLVMAGIHIAAAFKMITKLLLVFAMTNVGLFAVCTLVTFLIFAGIYALAKIHLRGFAKLSSLMIDNCPDAIALCHDFTFADHDVDINNHLRPSLVQRYMIETADHQMRDRLNHIPLYQRRPQMIINIHIMTGDYIIVRVSHFRSRWLTAMWISICT